LLIEERFTGSEPTSDAATRRCLDAVADAGGGRLADAIRRDGSGAARRLLARAVWLPDLGACLALQPKLPAGWVAVPRDGSAVVDDAGVALGTPDSTLDRRAEHARLAGELERADAERSTLEAAAHAATTAAAAARTALDDARTTESHLAGERRAAEQSERAASREAESIIREAVWHAAQQARLDGEVAHLRAALAAATPAAEASNASVAPDEARPDALATWEARSTELRDRRDRLAARLGTFDATRRDAEHGRARAEAAAAIAEERIASIDREMSALLGRESSAIAERDIVGPEIAAATIKEREARDALAALHAEDATDRARLADAERGAAAARERLRAADERMRAADHAELEARLGLESLREGVLVELAGMGELGRTSLGVGIAPVTGDGDEDRVDDVALEAALTMISARWAAEAPPDAVPSPGRLAQLRRRYHELGAANPFAVEEYAELKARLEGLEAQGADLHDAIDKTRELISELDTMISDQFRATFAALETAFERRFAQLFDGGYAKLSLTDPADLGSTGVEIVARPPGKKPQALAMLSGGERALTAVALLFAMLEVRPVPFCVLDEVDAALDEANIGRFAEALRSLADRTQFVVITHNRGTIESADALYGVTVGDDSVSRVISLRLDEAKALASDRRGELSTVG
jgi:chromosome segregation protein